MILIDLPISTISEANRRGHWRVHADRQAAQRETARLIVSADKGAVAAARLALSLGQTLNFRLVRRARRLLDQGNLAMSMKHVQDGVCDAIGFDDGPHVPIEWSYDQIENKELAPGVVLGISDNSEFLDLRRKCTEFASETSRPSNTSVAHVSRKRHGRVTFCARQKRDTTDTKSAPRVRVIHPHANTPSPLSAIETRTARAIDTVNSEFPTCGNSQFPPCAEKGDLLMGRPKGSKNKNAAHKQKKVNIQVIDRKKGETAVLYKMLDQLVAEHHDHLRQARIAIAWKHGWRADSDGRLKLGQARKTGPVDHELHEYDFVVLLNYEVFGKDFDPKELERLWPLLDHELMHCQVSKHADDTVKTDEKDRPVWRVRGHDIEEFTDIVERHGVSWRPELEQFIEAASEKRDKPLLKMAVGAQ